MSDEKVAALNPTIRRGLGTHAPKASAPVVLVADGTSTESCSRCNDTGIVRTGGKPRFTFGACPACRSPELKVYITQFREGSWIAIRDLSGLWGTGPSAIHAFMDMERRTPDSVSSFASQYRRVAASEADRHAAGGSRSERVA